MISDAEELGVESDSVVIEPTSGIPGLPWLSFGREGVQVHSHHA